VDADAVREAASGVQVTSLWFLVGKPLPFMDAGSIDGVGIDVTPSVALSTRGIEVGITPVVSVVMREMEGTVTFADGTRESEIALWSTHLHAFKGTGMIVVPVARGAVCFVLHDIRIA